MVPLEGAQTVRINFIGRRFEVALLKRLGWWDLVYVGPLEFRFLSVCVGVVVVVVGYHSMPILDIGILLYICTHIHPYQTMI